MRAILFALILTGCASNSAWLEPPPGQVRLLTEPFIVERSPVAIRDICNSSGVEGRTFYSCAAPIQDSRVLAIMVKLTKPERVALTAYAKAHKDGCVEVLPDGSGDSYRPHEDMHCPSIEFPLGLIHCRNGEGWCTRAGLPVTS